MFTHEFNVYETLAKLDGLLEAGHDDPSPMDRAEYKVLTNSLVRGAVELLSHLAMHDVLALETAESYELIPSRHVSTATTDTDGGFSDEIVTIDIPSHLVPYGAIVDSLKTWNLGTIETVADLGVLARLWTRYMAEESGSLEEDAIYAEWHSEATRVGPNCASAVRYLDAAGILRVRDIRTGILYPVKLVSVDGPVIGVSISTEADSPPPAPRKPSFAKKAAAKRRT